MTLRQALSALFVSLILAGLPADAAMPRLPAPPVPPAPFDAPQARPDSVALPGGGFVVAFVEGYTAFFGSSDPSVDGRDGDVEGIVLRLLDAEGRPVGEPSVASESVAGIQTAPTLAADPSTGGFVVAWLDEGQPRLRRFAADATPITGEIALIELLGFTPQRLDVAVDAAGTVVVVWEPNDAGSSIASIAVSSDGEIGEVQTLDVIPSGLTREPRIVVLPSGGFYVTFTDEVGVHGRRLDTDGEIASDLVTFDGAGSAGKIVDLQLADPASGSDELFAVTEDVNFGEPVRFLRLDPTTGTASASNDLPPGDHPEATVTPSGAILYAVETEAGLALHAFESAADEAGPVTLLPTAHGPVAMPVDASGDLLLVYVDAPEDRAEEVRVARVTIDTSRLFLGAGDRFEVRVTWRDFDGNTGEGFALSLVEDTGAFWFFDPENLELTVKVLDGRAINGHYWVFQGSLTNVEYTLEVTDTVTGATYIVTNPLGQFGSFGDIEALPGE